MTLPDFGAISPINFFQISADVYALPVKTEYNFPSLSKKNYTKYLLPDSSKLCGEHKFADVAIGWCAQGLELYVSVHKPFKQSAFPNISNGDGVEIFIDTRDIKTSGFNTKFCHHFYFLPESVEGNVSGEITHFRTEDKHALCDPNELKVKTVKDSGGYVMHIFIPQSCLTGYDPAQFNRFGFTYRINQFKGFSQHFSVVSEDYQLEQQPSLWASLNLQKN